MKNFPYLLILTVLTGITRVAGVNHVLFKDWAHLFIGTIFGLCIALKLRYYWYLFIGICILEIICGTKTFIQTGHVGELK